MTCLYLFRASFKVLRFLWFNAFEIHACALSAICLTNEFSEPTRPERLVLHWGFHDHWGTEAWIRTLVFQNPEPTSYNVLLSDSLAPCRLIFNWVVIKKRWVSFCRFSDFNLSWTIWLELPDIFVYLRTFVSSSPAILLCWICRSQRHESRATLQPFNNNLTHFLCLLKYVVNGHEASLSM